MKTSFLTACLTATLAVGVCPAHAQTNASAAPAPKNETGMFERSQPWTAMNLLYGPGEILLSPVILILGPVAGASAGANYIYGQDAQVSRTTWESIGDGALGTMIGLFMGPATLLKGACDTLTFGLFTDGVFF